MNRDIRAWSEDRKEMQYFNLRDIAENYSCPEGYFLGKGVVGDSGLSFDVMGDGIFRMRYTGLKDKYGCVIFEGDIVKTGGENYKVKLSEYLDSEGCGHYGWNMGEETMGNYLGDTEVLGNIYEHPDLILEGKE